METHLTVFTGSDAPATLVAVWEILKITWETGQSDELDWVVVGYEVRQ